MDEAEQELDVDRLRHQREVADRERALLVFFAGITGNSDGGDVSEIGQIESQPLLDGRNMVMVLAPTKNAGTKREDAENEDIEQRQEAV